MILNLYIDILGFEALASQIAEVSKYKNEDLARQNFLTKRLREQIEEIKKDAVSKGIEVNTGSDDYKIMVDDVATVFETIAKLSTIEIPFEGFNYIPS
jgi:hypothetical protein